MKTAKHINFLLKAEINYPGLMWDRDSKNTIYISFPGYKHMDFYKICDELRKLHCKYNFDKEHCVEQFDEICGRTFAYFKEPKKDAK